MANHNVFLGLSNSGTGTLANRNYNIINGDTITLAVNNNISGWNRWVASSSYFNPTSYSNTTGTSYGTSPPVVFTAVTNGSYTLNVYSYRSSSQGGYAYKSGRVYGSITGAAASYSLSAPTSIQEGNTGTVNISATNHTAGVTYWSVTPAADFSPNTGSTYVASTGTGSFSLSPITDNSTEGNETATIRLYSNSLRTIQIATTTTTITDQAASGGGGGSTGGGTTGGSTNQGINVFSQNGTKIFGTDFRTQNAQYEFSVVVPANSTTGTYSMADANNSAKCVIAILGFSSEIYWTINTSSTGFSISNTSSAQRTANVLAFRIG